MAVSKKLLDDIRRGAAAAQAAKKSSTSSSSGGSSSSGSRSTGSSGSSRGSGSSYGSGSSSPRPSTGGVDYSGYTTEQLQAMAAANSQDWHIAGTQQERDALHNANVEINRILDSRKGTSSTFDSGTGKWTSSGGSNGSKGSSGSSGSSGSRGSSSSGGSSSGGSSTPDYLKGLTGGTGAGNNAWASGVDDNGQVDFSVLLQQAMGAGASADEVQRLLDKRTDKALGDSSLMKYAYDDTYSQAMQYIMNNKKPEYDMADILGQINSAMSQYSAPQYEKSDWEKTQEALAKAALEMNYADWAKSDQYAALADRYGQQGEMSMRDVLGQIANRTGGLASSYATTAAQQQYNQYMSQLEQAAREMYAGERSDALQNAQLAGEFSDRDYQRYLERLSQFNRDRSFGFDLLSQVLQQSRYDQEWQNTLDQQEYQRQQDALKNSWYEREYADSMDDREYKRKLEQAKAVSGYSSGGGKSNSGGGAMDYDSLFRQAMESERPESFINNRYTDFGFGSKTGLYNEYKIWYNNEGYQYAITDISQCGQAARNILNSASRSSSSPAVIAEKVEAAKEKGTITPEEASFILHSIGH